jgi:hypothetical protein
MMIASTIAQMPALVPGSMLGGLSCTAADATRPAPRRIRTKKIRRAGGGFVHRIR